MATIRDRYVLDIDTKGAMSSLNGLKGALIAVGGAVAIKQIVDITARFEDLRSSLDIVTGSAAAGGKALALIKDFAASTQFSVEDLSSTFIQLRASGIDPTVAQLRLFTNTASVTTDQVGALQAMTKLYSQAAAGAGVQVEDLQILAERGIPVYKILKDRLGLVKNELTEFGSTATGTRKILVALEEGLNDAFGNVDLTKNLSAILSNFQESLREVANEFGTGLSPAIKEITTNITDFLNANKGLAGTIGKTLGDALLTISRYISEIVEKLGLLSGSGIQEFGADLISGLAGFVEGFAATADGFINAIKGLQNTLNQFIASVSKLGILEFNVEFVEAGQNRDDFIRETEARLETLRASVSEQGILDNILGDAADISPSLRAAMMYTGNEAVVLRDEIRKLEASLEALKEDNGETVFLERIEDNFNGVSTAASSAVESLRESAAAMRESAEAAKFNEQFPVYEDAILRYAAAQEAAAEANGSFADSLPEPEEINLLDAAIKSITASLDSYNESANERIRSSRNDAELAGLEGIKRQLREIQIEEQNLAEDAKRRILAQLGAGGDPSQLTQQYAQIDAAMQRNIQVRSQMATLIEDQKLAEEESQRSFEYGWKNAFDEYQKNATNAAEKAGRIFDKVTEGMEDAIVNFAKTGKFEFKDLVATIAEEILRSNIQRLIAQAFGGFGGGSSGGGGNSNFAGFFANGGTIPAGQFGIAGEAGAELISGPATVTPLNGLGGSSVSYYINAVDAPSFQQLVARDPGFIHAVAQKGSRSVPGRRR